MPPRTENGIILNLMIELDKLVWDDPIYCSEAGWVPVTRRGREILAELTEAHNRDDLRAWYAESRGRKMNGVAEELKRAIELKIGEKLD